MDRKSKQMSAAAREEQRRYHREWAAAHPENIRRNRASYWERKAQRRAAQEAATEEHA